MGGEGRLVEPAIARCVSAHLSPGAGLFLSNSMPCRDMDTFAQHSGPGNLCHVAMNRGANGIDGVVSSALGYAVGLRRPVTLLIGDMALLHDVNALHLLRQIPHPITIVCVNNGGSAIFSFLPIARHADVFSPYFDTPHDLSFEGVCSTFGVRYARATTPQEFERIYRESQQPQQQQSSSCSATTTVQHLFIEAVTDRADNVQVHRQLGAAATTAAHHVLLNDVHLAWDLHLPGGTLHSGRSSSGSSSSGRGARGTVVLLHGFMGSRQDW
ncbi:thiamine diphosphate-binding protein, partial [Tribonema minus]